MEKKTKNLIIKEIWLKIKNFFVGMITGLSDIVPGFSGGTLINITGYISKIVNSWKQLLEFRLRSLKWWLNFAFGMVFVAGWAAGFLGISKYVAYFLDGEFKNNEFWQHFNDIPMSITWLFASFVFGSVFTFNKIENIKILKFNNNKYSHRELFSKQNFLSVSLILAGFLALMAIGLTIVIHKHGIPEQNHAHKYNRALTEKDYLKLLLAGFLSSFSLLLPGVSGSMILLLLGVYNLFFGVIVKNPFEHLGGIIVYGVAAVISIMIILTFLEKISTEHSRLMRLFSLGMLGASWIVILIVFRGSLIPSTILSWLLTMWFVVLGLLFNYLIFIYFKSLKNKQKYIKKESYELKH